MDKILLAIIVWGGITAFLLFLALYTFFVRSIEDADPIYILTIGCALITGVIALFCLCSYLMK